MMAERSEGKPSVTVKELMQIIATEFGCIMLPGNDLDQVYPGVYIGDACSARSRMILMQSGITHVLNTAEGSEMYHVHINPELYQNLGIKWMGIEATDDEQFELEKFFDKTSEFIEEGLSQKGRVLVHCREGVSRSATVVLAFLMQKRHITAQDAMRQVHDRRNICPNDGFLQKLCDLNDKLMDSGHFKENK